MRNEKLLERDRDRVGGYPKEKGTRRMWALCSFPDRTSFVVPWIRTKWFQRTGPGESKNDLNKGSGGVAPSSVWKEGFSF
ncbi:hypothetical protein OIU78_014740 [Salix suchowensis]|nr:hypothetical protein OIU78_014740 [Salix suchowensis]